jgi:hypothetical protein
MKSTLAASLACAFLVTLGAACGGHAAPPAAPVAATPGADLPASTKAETKTDPMYATCHNAFKPATNDQDVGHDLDSMVKGCADTTKMKKVGDTLAGELSEKKPPVTLPLSVQAGTCYRVYGMSQSTMQDFDVAIIDSTGALVGEDTTDDVSPVIAEDGKVCFKVSDSATVRASAGAGSGKFALQVWSD